MHTLPLTALVSLCAVLLLFGTAWHVGKARHRYGVQAPATTGHPLFERAYRIQMNTLEWFVMTFPCLWICAAFVDDRVAAALGAVWVAARIRYGFAYQREPSARGPAFLVSCLAFGALGLVAGAGALRALLSAPA